MKKLTLGSLLAAGMFMLAVQSCDKNDSDSGSTPNPTGGSNEARIQLLTNGSTKSWKMIAFSTQDGPYTLDTCSLDDRVNYSKGGTLSITYGTDLCDPDEETINGTWSLSTDGNTLTNTASVNGSTMQQVMEIKELTESTMKVFYVFSGDSITETYITP